MRHYAMVKVEAVEPFNLHPRVPYTFIRCLRPFFFGGWVYVSTLTLTPLPPQ